MRYNNTYLREKISESKKLGPRLPFRETLLRRCQEYGVNLNIDIGQHLLVDQGVVEKMVGVIPPKAEVIEIGAGPGQITEALLKKDCRVVAIETDRQFTPFLDSLGQRYPAKLEVIYGNALDQNWRRLTDKGRKERVWLIGSLPYHITEPLMATIASLPIKGAVFLVGAKFAFEIKASRENSSSFGKLSLLVNTFFHPKAISEVNKSCFYPKPRTNSEIIILTPRNESDYLENKALFILRNLFLGAPRSPLLKNALKEALIRYKNQRGQKMTQNEARAIITTLNLPKAVLNKPLEQLTNQDLGKLYNSLQEKFGSFS